jgi:RNA polymerase sigma-70 factor, ECF subfamily
METNSDQQLVKAMLAGDERAFRGFFDSYFPRVYRFALPRLAGDADVTQDVVQAALMKAMRNLDKFRGESALFSWLCQICRNAIADHFRANKHHASNLVLIDDSSGLRNAFESIAAPSEHEPPQRYSEAQTRQVVRSLLDAQANRYGDVLAWKYMEGLSVEEIGARLEISATAAQSTLARARIGFREALGAKFGSTAQDVLSAMQGGVSGNA